MVGHKFANKIGAFCKKASILAVVVLTIANLLLADFALAKRVEIGSKDIERIKTGLDMIRLFANVSLGDERIRTALNLSLKGGEAGADVTYGLVVLSAMNEMELIDMVISQKFKTEATDYFNGIIDERINLISHWKGVGTDISRVATRGITGSMSALSLNSFSIGNDVLQIFLAVKNIAIVQKYNGLWGYFDHRRLNFSHEESWQNAKDLMKWIPDPKIIEAIKKETPSWAQKIPGNVVAIDENVNQLESQFAALWDKWGPYTDNNGVTEAAKKQFREEMGQVVLQAVEQQGLAEKEKEPSFVKRIMFFFGDKVYEIYTYAMDIVNTTIERVRTLGGAGAGQRVLEIMPRSEAERNKIVQRSDLGTTEDKEGKHIGFEAVQAPSQKSPTPAELAELKRQVGEAAKMVEALNLQAAALVREQEQKEDVVDNTVKDKKDDKKAAQVASICPVNINTASAQDLQAITGVGPVISQRIIQARPFYSLNDLIKAQGIGQATLQKIISQGCAYVSGFAGGGTSSPAGDAPTSNPKILISEVQIEGNSVDNDFIELYNPNDSDVDISGHKLRKRTSGGTESSIQVLPSGSVIVKKGYYLWASSKDENYPSSVNADISTTQTLASNNSIALLTPDDKIISALAWGSSTNPFVETASFPNNPGKNQSLGRIWDEIKSDYKNTGNNSDDFEIQTPSPKAKNKKTEPGPPASSFSVVVNEIAWMGTATSSNDEWIELHNTTKDSVDLTGWKLVSTDGSPDIPLSKTISPLGFYLLERTASTTTDVAEDQIYTGGLNNDPNCEILALYDQNNNLIDKTICREDGDKRYWPAGTTTADYITMERINPRTSGENSNNWANNNQTTRNGLDAAGNPINGTPRAQNSAYQSLAPDKVGNFALDTQNSHSNKAALTWATSTDPDNASEDLSYTIYYSKVGEITENNLTATSTLSATTTATTILISALDYNSTYYFGIKAYDPENNSSTLATTTPYQTATLTTIASGFSDSDLNNLKNNGRKIARASNGDLYVVYSRGGQIYLASSINNGMSWTELSVTPDAITTQKDPSIAIDADNILHIAWQGKVAVGTSTIYQIRYATYDGSALSSIENLTNDSVYHQEIPVIVIDSNNNPHIVWAKAEDVVIIQPDTFRKIGLIYATRSGNGWQIEEVNLGGSEQIIYSFNLAIDGQNNLHLVRRTTLFLGGSVIAYQKYIGSWQTTQYLYAEAFTFVSLAVDINGNLHITWNDNRGISYKIYPFGNENFVWGNNCGTGTDSQFYCFYQKSQILLNFPDYGLDLVISLDFNNLTYLVWSKFLSSEGKNRIYFQRYPNPWLEPQVLETENSQADQLYPNFLWSLTNQPKTGFAFIFYEGGELKFYASNDLTW